MSDLTYEVPCQTEGCLEQHTVSVVKDTTIICKCGETYHYKNDDNQNYQITWSGSNDSTTTEIQYYRNYRPVIEMITELSTQKINGDFNAYFFLDVNNNFIFKQKSKDTDTILIEEGYDFTNCKIIEKVWEVINAMI